MSYVYFDYKTGEIIFECEAQKLTEADQMLYQAKGIDPVKSPDIGCIPK